MVKHLPGDERKRALFYGLVGAFILRFGSLFIISFLVDVWQVQAIGAAYLLFISGKHLYEKRLSHKTVSKVSCEGRGFWMTVLKVEIVGLGFAVDLSMNVVVLVVSFL